MSSPYILRLSKRIDNATNLEEQLVARAELAGAFARYGMTEQARLEISELRRANSRYDPAVTCWILIAEGQLSHFKALAPAALGHFRGARAIADRIGRRDIADIAGAWMAASEYVAGDVLKAAQLAVDVLSAKSPDKPNAALSRSHLVIADSLNCAGNVETATHHYSDARRYASRDGDISMQSITLFNAAAFAVTDLAIRDCQQDVDGELLRRVELQLNSIANLDTGIGMAALSALVPLLQAEWLVSARQWGDALRRYREALAHADQQGQERWLAKHLAEMSLCFAKTGDMSLAKEAAENAVTHLVLCSDADTKAIANFRIGQTFELLGATDRAAEHRTLAQSELSIHRVEQQRLAAALDTIVACLNPVK